MRLHGLSRLRSVVRGAARAVDFFGVLSSPYAKVTGDEAQALYDDWRAVGEDIRFAMSAHKAEQESRQLRLF